LILRKGIFKDEVEWVKFFPQNEPVPEKYPYHVYNLNPVELKNGVKLVKP